MNLHTGQIHFSRKWFFMLCCVIPSSDIASTAPGGALIIKNRQFTEISLRTQLGTGLFRE
jgi:hypothetical protein